MTPGKLRIAIPASRIVVVFALVVGTLAVLRPASGVSSSPPCRVTNLSTTQVYDGTGSNLQSAIDGAKRGTRLLVRGVCVGNFTIGKNLKLFGRSTAAYPTPTLDGNEAGTVLTVSDAASGPGSVVLKDLTITHGSSTETGGGITNTGTLTLLGSSSVTDSAGPYGGGIYNAGTDVVTLRRS